MQHDSNVETPQSENDISNAVLTPHLNHPKNMIEAAEIAIQRAEELHQKKEQEARKEQGLEG